jgi:hypothetical protein
MESLGVVAQIIVGVGVDREDRQIPDRERIIAEDKIAAKYPNVTEGPVGSGSWVDSKGQIVREASRTYTLAGVGTLYAAQTIAEFIRDAYKQTAVVLIYNPDVKGYLV